MISKTSGYAIRGVTYLVSKFNEDRKIGIQEIAEALQIPKHFLAKILQELAKRNIIGSTKGPHGGFYALMKTSTLPVITIIEAIDGLAIFDKCELGRDECSHVNPCPIHFDMIPHRNKIIKILQEKSIGDMVKDVKLGNSTLENTNV